jgi:hypothetical protein
LTAAFRDVLGYLIWKEGGLTWQVAPTTIPCPRVSAMPSYRHNSKSHVFLPTTISGIPVGSGTPAGEPLSRQRLVLDSWRRGNAIMLHVLRLETLNRLRRKPICRVEVPPSLHQPAFWGTSFARSRARPPESVFCTRIGGQLFSTDRRPRDSWFARRPFRRRLTDGKLRLPPGNFPL